MVFLYTNILGEKLFFFRKKTSFSMAEVAFLPLLKDYCIASTTIAVMIFSVVAYKN